MYNYLMSHPNVLGLIPPECTNTHTASLLRAGPRVIGNKEIRFFDNEAVQHKNLSDYLHFFPKVPGEVCYLFARLDSINMQTSIRSPSSASPESPHQTTFTIPRQQQTSVRFSHPVRASNSLLSFATLSTVPSPITMYVMFKTGNVYLSWLFFFFPACDYPGHEQHFTGRCCHD